MEKDSKKPGWINYRDRLKGAPGFVTAARKARQKILATAKLAEPYSDLDLSSALS